MEPPSKRMRVEEHEEEEAAISLEEMKEDEEFEEELFELEDIFELEESEQSEDSEATLSGTDEEDFVDDEYFRRFIEMRRELLADLRQMIVEEMESLSEDHTNVN